MRLNLVLARGGLRLRVLRKGVHRSPRATGGGAGRTGSCAELSIRRAARLSMSCTHTRPRAVDDGSSRTAPPRAWLQAGDAPPLIVDVVLSIEIKSTKYY